MRELCRAGPSVRIVAIARATDHRQHEAHAQKAASPSGCAAATHDMSALFTPADGKPRCLWCAASPDYIAYHDHDWGFRSEEHTSELQSLMRISYAVFCLNKITTT